MGAEMIHILAIRILATWKLMRNFGTPDPRRVTLHNGRLGTDRFALERDGFHFVHHDTKVVDFFDAAELRRIYYAEMETLVKAESGASRVVVFDHTLRTADDDEREARKIREPVRRAHNDYTEWSGPQRVRDLLPQEAEQLLTRRFDLAPLPGVRERVGDLSAALTPAD